MSPYGVTTDSLGHNELISDSERGLLSVDYPQRVVILMRKGFSCDFTFMTVTVPQWVNTQFPGRGQLGLTLDCYTIVAW